jgi:hypothetical protein
MIAPLPQPASGKARDLLEGRVVHSPCGGQQIKEALIFSHTHPPLGIRGVLLSKL